MRFLDSFSTRNRLGTLEEAFEALQRKVKGLETEWNETLDKMNRLHGRIAKRAQLDAARAEHSERPDLPLTGPGNGVPLTINERQSRIQAEILQRRNRALVSKEG